MIAVLSEATMQNRESMDWQELYSITETARMLGCAVYPIPHDFSVCETAENALAYVPSFDPPIAGVWVGFITTAERYAEIYDAARAKGIYLLNTPREQRTVMEFDRYYPLLEGLTPRSEIADTVDACISAAQRIGYPVFVRGLVKSSKVDGWDACVAKSSDELAAIAAKMFKREYRSRGKVVIRELADLRKTGEPSYSFPVTREYRAFVHRGEILAYGFYWDEYADPIGLSAQDDRDIRQLVLEAANRLNVPFHTVDVGQLENGTWIVIEVGDAQCAGLSHIPVLELWGKIKDIRLDTSADTKPLLGVLS